MGIKQTQIMRRNRMNKHLLVKNKILDYQETVSWKSSKNLFTHIDINLAAVFQMNEMTNREERNLYTSKLWRKGNNFCDTHLIPQKFWK